MASDRRVLLVDDEPDILEALALVLLRARDLDVTVETAHSGARALEQLAAEPFDLVLADHRMPGMTGVDLLARVKDLYPDTVRALITGHGDLDVALDAVERARVHYYIQKPWTNDELRLTVREALGTTLKDKR